METKFEIGEVVQFEGELWEVADNFQGQVALWKQDHSRETDWLPEGLVFKHTGPVCKSCGGAIKYCSETDNPNPADGYATTECWSECQDCGEVQEDGK